MAKAAVRGIGVDKLRRAQLANSAQTLVKSMLDKSRNNALRQGDKAINGVINVFFHRLKCLISVGKYIHNSQIIKTITIKILKRAERARASDAEGCRRQYRSGQSPRGMSDSEPVA